MSSFPVTRLPAVCCQPVLLNYPAIHHSRRVCSITPSPTHGGAWNDNAEVPTPLPFLQRSGDCRLRHPQVLYPPGSPRRCTGAPGLPPKSQDAALWQRVRAPALRGIELAQDFLHLSWNGIILFVVEGEPAAGLQYHEIRITLSTASKTLKLSLI